MSGHSKWATTKHKKALVDAKRGKIFTKMAKLITIAARDGGGDPSSNPSLRTAIDNAKSVSLPKENIERAIQRGAGGGDSAKIEEIIYEAYGPGGMALIIECLTDNKNRTVAEVKAILNKLGGSFATAGSVSYLFSKKGEIFIDGGKNSKSADELEEAIINSGADDFEQDESNYIVYTSQQNLHMVKKALEDTGIVVESAELTYIANTYNELDPNKKESAEKLLDTLDDLDDVNKVYTNINL
ncbi:MAG: putative transcriptional regulatory protein YebC [bacterium ADurb.Bin212]|nr:MAG: putative transcriptional regulatory protein YebC [bacterium ADurb.Bin212]